MRCPTVKITADNEQGFMLINESDFDSSKHTKFEDVPPVNEDVPPVNEDVPPVNEDVPPVKATQKRKK